MEANNLMPEYVTEGIFSFLNQKKVDKEKSEILILGATYKENCSDIRNSKVFQIIDILNSNNCNIKVFDPYVDFDDIQKKYKDFFLKSLDKKNTLIYNIVLVAVAHKEFLNIDLTDFSNEDSMIFDIKGIIKKEYNNLKRL